MTLRSGSLVSAVEIKSLFGKRDYHLDFAAEITQEGRGRRLTLLYGNNGSGKTTILKLLWNALSSSNSEGYQAYIGRTPFRSLVIHLSKGDIIKFIKTDSLTGAFIVSVSRENITIVEQAYYEGPDGFMPLPPQSRDDMHLQDSLFPKEYDFNLRSKMARHRDIFGIEDPYAGYLANLGANPYMLADDRRIYGDDIEPKARRRIRRPAFEELERPAPKHGVAAELTTALQRVNDMMQRLVIHGNVSGSRGSNNVYLGILEKVAQTDLSKVDSTTREKLNKRLNEIATKTSEYSSYGLLPAIDRESFLNIIHRTPDEKIGVAEDVMQPFLEAQQARLDALSSVASLLATLTQEVNRFLKGSGKKFAFKLQRGVRVYSDDGQELMPEELSSGERQILLLLLNTVLARENTKLFLIDEPELSLNVKWQRQLMDALLALTSGSAVQFIVATHSIEVITGHQENLARVAPLSK